MFNCQSSLAFQTVCSSAKKTTIFETILHKSPFYQYVQNENIDLFSQFPLAFLAFLLRFGE